MSTRHMTTMFFVIAFALTTVGTAFGQDNERRVSKKELPKAVQKTVEEQSAGASIVGYAKEVEHGQTYYEVELRVNGHGKDVLIDPHGVVVEIEEEVALASLPAEVKATIERNTGKAKILKVESITKNNSIAAYEAQIQKSGRKSEIKVGPDGKLMPKEK